MEAGSDDGMSRKQVLNQLADIVVAIERPHPVRVAIDGVDAAGKTTLANELATYIEERGRPVIRASTDGFYRSRQERYRQGQLSPEGYYEDSFDYESIREDLLEQLGPGGSMRYRSVIYDSITEVFVYERLQSASPDAVLLFDGVFLLRPELRDVWDFCVFVHVDFEVALRRALERDIARFGSPESVRERYQNRYIPGQQLYLESVEPQKHADVVIDNNEPENPVLIASRL